MFFVCKYFLFFDNSNSILSSEFKRCGTPREPTPLFFALRPKLIFSTSSIDGLIGKSLFTNIDDNENNDVDVDVDVDDDIDDNNNDDDDDVLDGNSDDDDEHNKFFC